MTGQAAAIKIVSKKVAAVSQSESMAVIDKNLDAASGAPGSRVIPYGIEREVLIMKLIEHPNIVNLYDVWENRDELYVFLARPPKNSLASLLTSFTHCKGILFSNM
jgi:serine/threonine protein kinase